MEREIEYKRFIEPYRQAEDALIHQEDNFLYLWKKVENPSLQKQLMEGLAGIKDINFGQKILEELKTMFSEDSQEKKKNIIYGLGELGACLPLLENETVDVLLNLYSLEEETFTEEILEALRQKAIRANIERTIGQEPAKEKQERLIKIVNVFLEILNKPQEKEKKKEIVLKNIFDYANQPELAELITKTLRNVLKNSQNSFELQSMAADELANMVGIDLVKRGDSELIDNFKKRFEQKEQVLKDETSQLKFLNGLLRSGDKESLDMIEYYLNQGNPDTKSDDFSVVSHRAEEAKNVIEKFEAGKNEKI